MRKVILTNYAHGPFVHATNTHWCFKVHETMCNQTNKTSSKYTQLALCDIS